MWNMLINSPMLNDFENAVKRLKEVLSLNKTDIIRDSAIKRFEICFDLAWKLMKLYAKISGLECNSPRSCFKTAFELKLIDYDEKWLEMLDDRNLTAHVYREQYADEVYSRLRGYLALFERLMFVLAQ